jgi:hypothetical protein
VIVLRLERAQYQPGDVVRGVVDVPAPVDARELRVALEYVEASRDYSGVGRSEGETVLHTGPVGGGSQYPFELAIPVDAGPAFRTERTAVWWRVHAKADKPGFDRHSELRIDMWSPEWRGLVIPVTQVDLPTLPAFLGGGSGSPVPAGPPPAGWYPDPWGKAAQRWWDGRQWTGHTA